MAKRPIRCRLGFHAWEIADMAFDARVEPWVPVALLFECPRCEATKTKVLPREDSNG